MRRQRSNAARDLCKTPDLSTVQSNSIAERADNIEIFSSVREAHCAEMCQRWGFCKGLCLLHAITAHISNEPPEPGPLFHPLSGPLSESGESLPASAVLILNAPATVSLPFGRLASAWWLSGALLSNSACCLRIAAKPRSGLINNALISSRCLLASPEKLLGLANANGRMAS